MARLTNGVRLLLTNPVVFFKRIAVETASRIRTRHGISSKNINGVAFEFDAMTAAIIGGTSFSGGIGTAVGTLAGAFIMGFLGNIMNLVGVGSYMQQIIKGAIIALAVAYDIMSKTKRSKRILGDIAAAPSPASKATPAV